MVRKTIDSLAVAQKQMPYSGPCYRDVKIARQRENERELLPGGFAMRIRYFRGPGTPGPVQLEVGRYAHRGLGIVFERRDFDTTEVFLRRRDTFSKRPLQGERA